MEKLLTAEEKTEDNGDFTLDLNAAREERAEEILKKMEK